MSEIVSYKEFNEFWFRSLPAQPKKAGNQGTKAKRKYKDVITAFDIETTNIDKIEQNIMYIWQWQFGDKYTVIGRTWDEFIEFCKILKAYSKDMQLVVYVHNLSYEFQYLKGIYPFTPDEVFAIESRKVLKCCMYGFLEFRCSYLHSNMSLKAYTEKMGAEHSKLSGDDFDYSIKRYPWTVLTDQELQYCINDVLGLVEALTIEMKHDGDNLYTIPLTSTGYVRRDAKRAMKKVSHYFVKRQLPDYYTYCMCRAAFRGGNTHANRFYVGKVVTDVSSADRSSSYPDILCNCEYPIRPFYHYGSMTFDELMECINIRHKAVLMKIQLTNLRLREWWWGCPYLSKDKCDTLNGVYDNGRILSADLIETTITDIDLKIILSEYDFDNFVVIDACLATYGKLPKTLIDINIRYYKAKTELKGIEGQELYYMKSKNKLNSIYGMMAQDPVKQSVCFENGLFIDKLEDPSKLLDQSNAKAFLCYQWGVWTTAWARYRLEEGIRLAGKNFVYCDTDSVKYTGTIDWTDYNKKRIKDSKASGSYATDPKGKKHYMGVFEFEGIYDQFATLGAKKYCYVEDGKLTATIAGVNKSKGGPELGCIENFKEGFIFSKAGGTESIYNDFPTPKSIKIDGHKIPITSNIYLKDSTYTLGITAEYGRLLEIVKYKY